MMMLKEFDLAGVYLSPMLFYALIAAVPWALVRAGLGRAGAYRLIWHPPLFNTALYLVMLAGVAAALHQ